MIPRPSLREIVLGLYGAWRLALLDRGGMSYFDASAEGFWKSFFGAALVAPGYVILVLLDPTAQNDGAGAFRSVLIHALTYSLSWTVYPVVVHPILQAMGRGTAYTKFIVAFNWAKVIQMALYLPVVGIVAAQIMPGGAASLLNAGMYMLLLGYQWVVTRTALDIKPMAATGLVALDFVVGVILSVLAAGMLH